MDKGEEISSAQTAVLLTQVVDSCTLAMQADCDCNILKDRPLNPTSSQVFRDKDSPTGAQLFGNNLPKQVNKLKDQAAVKVAAT